MLTVHVKYFGKLREILNIKSEVFSLERGNTVSDLLLKEIPARHNKTADLWIRTLYNVKNDRVEEKKNQPFPKKCIVLVNGKPINRNNNLNDCDEIAILPPFGGG